MNLRGREREHYVIGDSSSFKTPGEVTKKGTSNHTQYVDRLPKRAKLYPLVDLATGSSILNAGAFGGNIANNFFYEGALTSDGYNLSSDNGLPRPSGSEP